MSKKTDYLMSFTAGELYPSESASVAAIYIKNKDWKATLEEAKQSNIFFVRSEATLKRYLGEIILRLKSLSDEELAYLIEADKEDQGLLMWVACCRTYKFIQNFATEVLRMKYLRLDMVLSRSDINQFYYEESLVQTKLSDYSDQTRQKLIERLVKLTKQAGLISDDWDIRVGFMSRGLAKFLARNCKEDLTLFPLSEVDIAEYLR